MKNKDKWCKIEAFVKGKSVSMRRKGRRNGGDAGMLLLCPLNLVVGYLNK
jgi:hypothetical protein